MFRHQWVGLALLGCAGCNIFSADKSPVSDGAPVASARSASAGEGAMCKEHGVLEAVCTKCNPKLIPVFQAKGDWCAEHGFPESFCPICHPEAGGKPQASLKKDDAPTDGMKLRFKRADTARLAGIEVVTVETRTASTGLLAPVRLSYDATKLAQVNARSPGVVKALKVDIGVRVKKGQALIVIDSPDVGADRARLGAAKSRVAVAEENLARDKKLVEEGLAAQRSLLSAQQEVESAKAEHAALAASLSVLGAGGGGVGGYTLTAPLSGVVTERRVTIGKLVGGEEVLLEIVDTSTMWADVEVAEQELSRVVVGQPVTLTFDALGQRELAGKIDYVAPSVDPHTRTAKARVPLENPDGVLRANLFGQARIAASGERTGAFVPRAAVQRAGETSFVFVRLSELEYEVRRVKLASSSDETLEVTSGLKPGEQVVTTGSFLLKTETSKESIGAGCCDD
jgi:cobalt-zinc-cadmium efflux system membrane fusion protein